MADANRENWDAGFRAGRYDFLHRPAERARLAAIGRLVGELAAMHGPCAVADIGCGEGLLLDYLEAGLVSRYIGIDISAVALSRFPRTRIAVSRICAPLSQWEGWRETADPLILVASEVLYYDAGAVADLKRATEKCANAVAVIVSCVAGAAGKPNWERASRRLWLEMKGTGWPTIRMFPVRDSGLTWNIAVYRA